MEHGNGGRGGGRERSAASHCFVGTDVLPAEQCFNAKQKKMLTFGCRRGVADMAVDDSGEDEGDDDDDASDEEDQDEWDPTNATPAKQR